MEEGSKDTPRSRGEGLSSRTSEPSTYLGTKPQPAQTIEHDGDRLLPNAPNVTGGSKSK